MRSLHVLGVVTGLFCAAVQAPVARATPANFKPPLPADLAQGVGESLTYWHPGVPHNHSVVSDGENPWPDMLSRYQGMPGIDWAAMTDHYPSRYGGFWMDVQEYGDEYDSIRDNWQKQGFAGVPGMEVTEDGARRDG
ncbi:hypothetical protein [Vitiosangium sp. GDMCC 1.1324]|uniref:hypothetical protein n=1 Tax=Vitiosangium sp. (strain GDMCC 1.1324) TaxID=2138576 RepID=UPI000D3A2D4A|nr:hypothetical protein [Vitiosangium sp. GDMCC 1.1324]PTL83398.1 hypothetical protein DAT35_15600 [Vitiosangium sp. GDMCC 1.1324]